MTNLFKEFIEESRTGKRLRKNGERIKPGTINNYRYTLNNLLLYEEVSGSNLIVNDYSQLNQEQRLEEKRKWKNFYREFIEFLYQKGCYDNYVGANIKNIRTFFNYLNNDRDIITGSFYKQFYVRKEHVEILVLSPERLKMLIHDKALENKLSKAEKRVKDAFVFGCTTGLRFSDLSAVTYSNLITEGGNLYLKTRSKKTKTFTSIKLPDYAISIIRKHRTANIDNNLFKPISLFIFNRTLKKIGEKAGFTENINDLREKQGIQHRRSPNQIRFCDKMSSHMMRRTAITTMLTLGMPEHLVKKISGHDSNSKSFSRYVHYSNSFLNQEIEKFNNKLSQF